MRVTKEFAVSCPRDTAVAILERDETLEGLFPDGRTEIVARDGDRRTTRTRYRALGREGVATFHFDMLLDGSIRFEKVCDGRVWRELGGRLTFEEEDEGTTRVRIEMEGRTRPLVPEIAIRQPMREQIDEMARALRDALESGAA